MHTVLELINLSTDYLTKKEIESPRLNAELLLAGILNCKRLELYLMFDKPLGEEEVVKYREYLKRRGAYEPLQYIIGDVEFYGLTFNVNPSVLIPRQETEILIETLIEKTGKETVCNILDIGTGSGIIAISLAKHLINSTLTAVDISGEAIKTAEENSVLNNVEAKIKFIEKDILNGSFEEADKFDVVVSNPPYISEKDYSELQKEITGFEPKIALTDFEDGYRFYKAITQKAKDLLQPGGVLAYEIGLGQAEEVKKIMEQSGYKNILIKKDYLDIERVIMGENN
jgi:release factor glutamine methyltransferase